MTLEELLHLKEYVDIHEDLETAAHKDTEAKLSKNNRK